ncbi:hypothetical protein IWQ62_000280 [Dispira parvispora]|uniref:Fungal lipase-type domain-containing protein n=1 Tax=Dispira parvispora TaxID=1520584 RepID=A0A9W8EAC2_9FUNG|nr:hypothetical protein IWQ62_000280 [Dispira parvispora]
MSAYCRHAETDTPIDWEAALPLDVQTDHELNLVDSDTESNLVVFAEYAAAAYHNVEGWNCNACTKTNRTENTTVIKQFSQMYPSSNGYLAVNDRLKRIILGFRGSRSVLSYVSDLKIKMTQWPPSQPESYVHSGFLDVYLASFEHFHTLVEEELIRRPDYTLAITGHSLGGAVSVLAAIDLALKHPELTGRVELYTYGQPRVGNRYMALLFDSLPLASAFRVTNMQDVVPRLPLRSWGYSNFNHEYWIRTDDVKLVHCAVEEKLETELCSLSSQELPSHRWLTQHLKFWDVVFW